MLKKVGIVAVLALSLAALLIRSTDRSTATPKPGEPERRPVTELFDFSEPNPVEVSLVSRALEEAGADGKFLFVYFHQKNDPSQLLPVLRTAKSQFGDRAYFVEADVNDKPEGEHLARYGVKRTPFVVVVAPNGAVTAGFGAGATSKDLEKALVSEAIAQLTLAVQNRDVVFLVVGNDERIYFEQAMATADSSVSLLEGIAQRIVLDPYEEETRRILQNNRIKIDPDMTELLVVAPNGGLAGRFPGNATPRDLLDSFQRILAQNKGCGARTLTGGSPCEPGRGVSGGRGCGAREGTQP